MLRPSTLALLTALAAPMATAAPRFPAALCPPPTATEKCAPLWPRLMAAPRDGIVLVKATAADASASRTDAPIPSSATAPAQIVPLRPGETARHTLGPDDPALDDGTTYRLYRLDVAAGQRYTLTLASDAFDAFLAIGTLANETGDAALDVIDSDDDDGGGTDARIAFTAPETGRLYARANALSEGETGAYTLALAAAASAAAPMPIAMGQTVQGALENTDATIGDGSYADLYTFRAEAGQTFEITLASDDFDAYLSVGTGSAEGYAELDFNDDGAGPDDGTHARIAFTAPSAGLYLVRANSLDQGETGRYRLRIDRR